MPCFAESGLQRYCHSYIFTSSSNTRRNVFLFVICMFFSQMFAFPLASVSSHASQTSMKFFNPRAMFNAQIAAAICASFSMMASFVVFFWFVRMQKHFRHRLIMLLIYGDLTRASWLFLFATVSITQDHVYTESAFCQCSGFFIQYGTETADFAVLAIAVHSALQVFRPFNQIRSDGLYPYRHFIYVGALVFPLLMAGLAFINPHFGYMSLGAFCTLPVRPFWYRLALTWIPRYLITIIILGLAVAIYVHVGFEFRSLWNAVESTKPGLSTSSNFLDQSTADGSATGSRSSGQPMHSHDRSSPVVSTVGTSRKTSIGASFSPQPNGTDENRYSHCDTATSCHGQQASSSRSRLERMSSFKPRRHDSDDASPLSRSPTAQVQRRLARQRSRIHRQLRLMFIYPLVYIIMWIIPFVQHCMNYFDKWVAHPIYALYFLSVLCVTLMGAVDCVIFSLRERPWRHIPSTDGSFSGSFLCQRTLEDTGSVLVGRPGSPQPSFSERNPITPSAEMGYEPRVMSSVLRVARNTRTSGSSDMAKHRAEMARARLEFEREDRRRANEVKMGNDDEIDFGLKSWNDMTLGFIDIEADGLEGVDIGGREGEETKEQKDSSVATGVAG